MLFYSLCLHLQLLKICSEDLSHLFRFFLYNPVCCNAVH